MRTTKPKPVLYRTLLQWTEPDGTTRHEPGEVTEIDPARVFDLADLIKGGTVEQLPDETQPDEAPVLPSAPVEGGEL